MDDILECRATRGSDDTNPGGTGREHAFAISGEKPLRFEHCFPAQELLIEQSFTGYAQNIGDQLILPTGFVHRQRTMHFDLLSIEEGHSLARCLSPPHDTAQLSRCVFDGEINMPRRRPGQIRNLALHPAILQIRIILDAFLDMPGDPGDCPKLGL